MTMLHISENHMATPAEPDTTNELSKEVEEVVEQAAEAVEAASEEAAADPEKAEKPAYTPNYKFNVDDKEYEFDEVVRPVIKDEETYNKVRDLYTKAHGLDVVKSKHEKLKLEHEGFRQKMAADIVSPMVEILNAYKAGDIETFFAKSGLDEQKFLQYVAEKVEYNQADPETRAQMDERKRVYQEARQHESSAQGTMSELEKSREELFKFQFNQAVTEPQAVEFAKKFESIPGVSKGAFQNAILEEGELAYQMSGRKVTLTPSQVVERVIRKYTPFVSANPNTPSAPQAQKDKPKIIPNVQSGSDSPVDSMPSSIDDLRKIRIKKFGG